MDALPFGTYRALAEKLSEYLPIILYGTDGVEASKKTRRQTILAQGQSSDVNELIGLGSS